MTFIRLIGLKMNMNLHKLFVAGTVLFASFQLWVLSINFGWAHLVLIAVFLILSLAVVYNKKVANIVLAIGYSIFAFSMFVLAWVSLSETATTVSIYIVLGAFCASMAWVLFAMRNIKSGT